MTSKEILDYHIGQVVCALCQLGHYHPTVLVLNKNLAEITNLPKQSPYHKITVKSDGRVSYSDEYGNTQLDGTTKSIARIKGDILSESIEHIK